MTTLGALNEMLHNARGSNRQNRLGVVSFFLIQRLAREDEGFKIVTCLRAKLTKIFYHLTIDAGG